MNTSYQKYLKLSELEKDEVCNNLSNQVICNGGFVCPTLKVPLNLPCSLKDCNYNTDNEWFKNCILFYMHQEGLDKLTKTEIAFLFKIREEEVSQIYKRQLSKIRNIYLRKALKHENRITYLTDIDICCVCDHKTNSSIKRDGLTYCGPFCLKEKPTFIFDMERSYQSDIKTIITTAMNLFKSIETLESVLRISRKKIEYIIKKYSPDLSHKFFNITNSDSDFLMPKERKSIVCIKMLNSMEKRRKQFGIPEKSLLLLYKGLTKELM